MTILSSSTFTHTLILSQKVNQNSIIFHVPVWSSDWKLCSLSPPAGRCWWYSPSWRETQASPSPIASPTERRRRPPWATGLPPRPPTAPTSPLTLTGCTDPGLYDPCPLHPPPIDFNSTTCRTTEKNQAMVEKSCGEPWVAEEGEFSGFGSAYECEVYRAFIGSPDLFIFSHVEVPFRDEKRGMGLDRIQTETPWETSSSLTTEPWPRPHSVTHFLHTSSSTGCSPVLSVVHYEPNQLGLQRN